MLRVWCGGSQARADLVTNCTWGLSSSLGQQNSSEAFSEGELMVNRVNHPPGRSRGNSRSVASFQQQRVWVLFFLTTWDLHCWWAHGNRPVLEGLVLLPDGHPASRGETASLVSWLGCVFMAGWSEEQARGWGRWPSSSSLWGLQSPTTRCGGGTKVFLLFPSHPNVCSLCLDVGQIKAA